MDLPREAMLEHKRGEWDRLRASYPALPAEPNNAFLASIAVYTELVPAFERLLAESGNLEDFYRRVKKLRGGQAARARRLLQERGISTAFLNAGRAHSRSNQRCRFGCAGRSIGSRIQRCTWQPSGMSPMVRLLPAK